VSLLNNVLQEKQFNMLIPILIMLYVEMIPVYQELMTTGTVLAYPVAQATRLFLMLKNVLSVLQGLTR
jgi:hypothetical protein